MLAHMGRCAVSVHELSRVGTPARFNMSFELGLAYAAMGDSSHAGYRLVVLERVPHRLSKTLSDLSAVDALIHHGRPPQVIASILDAPGTGQTAPSASEVYMDWRHLTVAARALELAEGRSSLFTPTLFRRLTAASAELAVRAGRIGA